jgi:hypothetical protein
MCVRFLSILCMSVLAFVAQASAGASASVGGSQPSGKTRHATVRHHNSHASATSLHAKHGTRRHLSHRRHAARKTTTHRHADSHASRSAKTTASHSSSALK